jgi:NAD(P)-dependent dehydrogenase (short-subunit alcohol dehydrogenase family)
MSIGNVVSALVTGGAGVSVGAIGTAIVQAMSGKNQSRAHAADLVADAAGNLADRLSKLNEKLDGENRQMRTAILLLTDQVDTILPLVNAPPHTIATLKKSNNAAKLAV